eukprot:scaffold7108_cov129-Isochrysis_galbana.AAC.4
MKRRGARAMSPTWPGLSQLPSGVAARRAPPGSARLELRLKKACQHPVLKLDTRVSNRNEKRAAGDGGNPPRYLSTYADTRTRKQSQEMGHAWRPAVAPPPEWLTGAESPKLEGEGSLARLRGAPPHSYTYT